MRWSANDLEVIRGFGDKYQDLSLKERKYQRAAHYLSGIERIISEPELARNYTFETTYREPNGKTRRGLGLYARMVDNGGNSYLGIVRLGIDPNRVIYHAMIGEGTCSLADIKKQSETDSPANGPWENISESSFNLVTNEGVERVISLENGKKEKDRVTFLFYPLV
jgi:hypothetical protein